MKKYFRLLPFCKFINTKSNACIYNYATGEVYNLNNDYVAFLEKIHNQGDILSEEDMSVAADLNRKGLGRFYKNPVYVPEIFHGYTLKNELALSVNTTFSSLFLEMSKDCNLDCVFCDFPNKFRRKTGCAKSVGKAYMSYETGKAAIEQSKLLGVKQIVLIGGEPFLNFSVMKNLVEFAKKLDIVNFVIYTNGYELTTEHFKFIEDNNIFIILQLLSFDKNVSSKMISKENYVESVNLSMKNFGNYRILFLVSKFNEGEINKSSDMLKACQEASILDIGYVYPGNKEDYSANDKALLVEPKFQNVTLATYSENTKHHFCFSNSIAIATNGDVLPCAMLKDAKIGNLEEEPIHKIMRRDEYLNYKYLSKDEIEPCNQCSYKYGCSDCRAIESDITKTAFCKIAEEICFFN